MSTKSLSYWIINSLLETDSYKFSMGQVIFHHFNKDKVTWSFKCRSKDAKFTPDMVAEIRRQIDHYCTLAFTEEELEWLGKNLPWIKSDYIDYLRFWHPRRCEILVNEGNIQAYNDCGLAIECHGTELNTSMYEIAILAIVSEVYFAFKHGEGAFETEFIENTIEKFNKLVNANSVAKLKSAESGEQELARYLANHPYDIGTFSEFGLRRRYSSKMQDWLIKYIVDKKTPGFVGTSNVYLAKKYGIKACGTMAHEMFQLLQGHHEFNPAYSNMLVLKSWVKEYMTDNGIALTDCIGTDCFLLDFNKTYATLFSGVRHDSGDPIAWGEKMVAHYNKLGIDPMTKTLLFSDSLNFEKATSIKKHFDGKCKVAFGLGTFLSNPLTSVESLNIVCKLTEVNGSACAKISDTPGKGMCRDEEYVEYLKRCIDWRLRHES